MSLETKRQAAKPIANGKPVEVAPWRKNKAADGSPGPGISAAEIVSADFPLPRFVVEGVMPAGLTVLGGRPKQGKSWLALLIGWAVAGDHPLDDRATAPGAVIYLALEDTRHRLKARIKMLGAGADWNPPQDLRLHTHWPRGSEEQRGLYFLAEWLDAQKDARSRLVIVDTLAKFRPPSKGASNSYQEDYDAVGDLKQFLDHYQASGLLIHHTRKLRAEDPFDELSGTLGISGAADSLWVLDRQRGSDTAKLFVTGRDIGDQTVALAFDKTCCRWVVGAGAEGIDTTGRGDASAATSKLDQCTAWLKDFLKKYAYPSDEIEAAGVAAGFAPTTVREAKVRCGSKGTREVTHKQLDGLSWWSGIGLPIDWKRRPVEITQ